MSIELYRMFLLTRWMREKHGFSVVDARAEMYTASVLRHLRNVPLNESTQRAF